MSHDPLPCEASVKSRKAQNVNLARLIGVIPALLVGFIAGLVTYRKSRRWCTACGATLHCPDCAEGLSGRVSATNAGPRSRRTGS
jgi:hypothetical protein